MERAAYYGFFALRCGWTVDEVDRQPDWYISRLPAFIAIHDEVQAEKQKAASK